MTNDLYYHPSRNTQEVAQVFADWVITYYTKESYDTYRQRTDIIHPLNAPKTGLIYQLYEYWLKQEAK